MKRVMQRKKEVNVSQLLKAMQCFALYYHKVSTRWTAHNETTYSVRGTVAHALVDGSAKEAAMRKFVEKELSEQPAETRLQVLTEAVAMQKAAKKKRGSDVGREDLNKHMCWELNGWKIFGSADDMCYVGESLPGKPHRQRVLQIREYKSAERAREHHFNQLKLYALLASEVFNHDGVFKLVVSPMHDDVPEEVRYFKPHWKQRIALEETLARLQEYWEGLENDGTPFPKTAGFHCRTCPLVSQCQQGCRFTGWTYTPAPELELAVVAEASTESLSAQLELEVVAEAPPEDMLSQSEPEAALSAPEEAEVAAA